MGESTLAIIPVNRSWIRIVIAHNDVQIAIDVGQHRAERALGRVPRLVPRK
jgi:hypothetical protein